MREKLVSAHTNIACSRVSADPALVLLGVVQIKRWEQTGLYDEIKQTKKVVVEPQNISQFEQVTFMLCLRKDTTLAALRTHGQAVSCYVSVSRMRIGNENICRSGRPGKIGTRP